MNAIRNQYAANEERIREERLAAHHQRQRVERAQAVLAKSGRRGEGSPQAKAAADEAARLAAIEGSLEQKVRMRGVFLAALAAQARSRPPAQAPFKGLVFGADGSITEVTTPSSVAAPVPQ